MRSTLLKVLAAVGGLLLIAALLVLGRMSWESRLPSTYRTTARTTSAVAPSRPATISTAESKWPA